MGEGREGGVIDILDKKSRKPIIVSFVQHF